MNKQYLDETEIRKAISIIKNDSRSGVFEIRIIRGNRKAPACGFFVDANTAIEHLHRQDLRESNVYISLNELKKECHDKTARDKFVVGASGAKDTDVEGRWWIMVDLDPKRTSDISSSDEQVRLAKLKAEAIYDFLKQQGFKEPVRAFSGNGYHLLYRVALLNSDENNKIVIKFLKTLGILFSDGTVDVDVSTFNPSRVCKLYGTLAQKGSDTSERPHRMSRIEFCPEIIEATRVSYLEKVNKIIPDEPDKPQRYNNYHAERFDLVAWMQKYGLHYRTASSDGGTKYILDHCPFDEGHKGKDAMIFQGNNGAIGFHCFHNSCQDKTWRDVRIMFEPDAYERKWQEQDQRMYGRYNRDRKSLPPPPEPLKPTPDNPIWYTPMDVYNMPKEDVHYIKTGYEGIDNKLYGLKKKAVSVLTGLRSAGKSTWLDGVILNAIQDGNTVGCYSGELDERNFMRWIIRQAAGRTGVERGRNEGQWNVPKRNIELISKWMQGKFFLYNNHHGNNYLRIHEELEKKIEADKLDFVVLDNLMALDIDDYSYHQLDAQKKFVLSLKQLAEKSDVHIMFVAHPRKTVNFLRLEDISGSADLANAVDNAFLIHRNNQDFRLRSHDMFKWKEDHIAYSGTNVIEVAKDRESGTQDWFIPLWYEPETKRLKSSESETIWYGWQKEVRTAPQSNVSGFVDVPKDMNVFDTESPKEPDFT